jgi:hypothetical protein
MTFIILKKPPPTPPPQQQPYIEKNTSTPQRVIL